MDRSNGLPKDAEKLALLFERAAVLAQPSKRTTPDVWGAENRVYPPTSALPGPRDPGKTPYTIPFMRATSSRLYRTTCLVMFAQGGKSEALLDIVGQRLDQSPTPILYVGPNKQFITEQFEPRVMALLDQAPTLKKKVLRGKRMTQTRKVINGVPWRLAHGGSSAALKSDPFGLCITDEADELMANVKGQGDPITLIDRRGDTYADFVHAIVSTTSQARIETEVDPDSGLEFWVKNTDTKSEVPSRVWQIFQSGTMYHWAWPCPDCGDYFIPRFKCLSPSIQKATTAAEARRMAHLTCPLCGSVITDDQKEALNARGVPVAPGQWVTPEGEVMGDPPEAAVWSMWVSGLANPFKTFGELAEEYVNARDSGTPGATQAIINGMFGEPYWPGFDGKTAQWQILLDRKAPYKVADAETPVGEIPSEVLCTLVGVDVQGMSLRYVIRGFGARARSWLLEAGTLHGPTSENDVWDDLADLILTPRDGMIPRLVMIDSGFRPDKKDMGDVHKVYDFARRYPQLVIATKGRDVLMTGRPVSLREHEVNREGRAVPFSIRLATLDTDHFKSLVWSRIMTDPGQPGTFYVPMNVTEDYCRQIASEVREFVNGRPKWIPISRENHFFDCEAMIAAGAYLLNVQRIPDGARRPAQHRDVEPPPRADTTVAPEAPTPPPPIRRSGFLGPRREPFLRR